ncbi:MAG: uroporphyrinogen-III synthase [Marinilabiliaceae bacterium]|nr:uroporphyrinogen-III synthase [Marinilabiliaceae bacterium]
MSNTIQHQPVIILTHPHNDKDVLKKGLVKSGLEVITDVMIETDAIALSEAEKKVIFSCRRIILTSKRGVEYLFTQLRPAEILDKSFICIGKKTAMALERKGIKPWWVSHGKTASDLVNELRHARFQKNEKWIALLGDLAEDTLEEGLSRLCDFQRINIYRTTLVKQSSDETVRRLQKRDKVLVVCTSPSCFHGYINNYSNHIHPGIQFASIGPVTTKAMFAKGIEPMIEANRSTYEGLLLALKSKLTPIYR